MIHRGLGLIILVLLLAGCSGDPKVDWTARLAVACDSYASTLQVLSQRRAAGKLKPHDVRTVNAVRILVNPICAGPAPADARAALMRIEEPVRDLIDIKEDS
jgi:hypothetical protein